MLLIGTAQSLTDSDESSDSVGAAEAPDFSEIAPANRKNRTVRRCVKKSFLQTRSFSGHRSLGGVGREMVSLERSWWHQGLANGSTFDSNKWLD